jgi:hypothetical protein
LELLPFSALGAAHGKRIASASSLGSHGSYGLGFAHEDDAARFAPPFEQQLGFGDFPTFAGISPAFALLEQFAHFDA